MRDECIRMTLASGGAKRTAAGLVPHGSTLSTPQP